MTWQLGVLIADMAVLLVTLITATYSIYRINWDFAHSMHVLTVDHASYKRLVGTSQRLRVREWLNWDFTRYMK